MIGKIERLVIDSDKKKSNKNSKRMKRYLFNCEGKHDSTEQNRVKEFASMYLFLEKAFPPSILKVFSNLV